MTHHAAWHTRQPGRFGVRILFSTLTELILLIAGMPTVEAASLSSNGAKVPRLEFQYANTVKNKSWVLANIIGEKDGRGSLLELGPKLGMSKEEIQQARASTGYVYCESSTKPAGTEHAVSGFLALSNQVVVTAGHAFWGTRIPTKLKCFFQNQRARYQREELDFSPGAYYVGSAGMVSQDYAVIRLKHPIRGAVPYQIASMSGDPTHNDVGAAIIAVISHQNIAADKDHAVPLVEGCNIRQENLTDIYTDCDMAQFGSGSVNLIRQNGRLVAKAMTVASGSSKRDYFPYNPALGSVTRAMLISDSFLKAVVSLAHEGTFFVE
jgi:hypothetical protein